MYKLYFAMARLLHIGVLLFIFQWDGFVMMPFYSRFVSKYYMKIDEHNTTTQVAV